jgi:hypothetical protein
VLHWRTVGGLPQVGIGIAPSFQLHVRAGASANYVAEVENTAASGNCLSLKTTSTSSSEAILGTFSAGVARFIVFNDGGCRIGSPTGGNRGAGTLNASQVFDDNVLLTDALWDLYYDGKVRPEDEARWGSASLHSIEETEAYARDERHLPSIPGRAEWERDGKFGLGTLVSALWETAERQALHIFELNRRLAALEARCV